MELCSFWVEGEIRGKGRPKFARRGKFVHTYTDDKTESYENRIAGAAVKAMKGKIPFSGAVALTIACHCPIPTSWSKKKHKQAAEGLLHPLTKPDIDNIVKAFADGMNSIVYRDDKQIIKLTATKHYSNAKLGVFVVVEEFISPHAGIA